MEREDLHRHGQCWRSGSNITLVALYGPPRVILSPVILDPLVEVAGSGHLIVGADLNAKHPDWGGTITNANGRFLRDWILTTADIDILRTSEPSRPNSMNGSYIDFFMISQGLMESIADGLQTGLRTMDFESDHKAVELLEPITIFDYQTMDCSRFNNILIEKLTAHVLPMDRDITEYEIDNAVLALTDAYSAAMNGSPREIFALTSRRNTGLNKIEKNIEATYGPDTGL